MFYFTCDRSFMFALITAQPLRQITCCGSRDECMNSRQVAAADLWTKAK